MLITTSKSKHLKTPYETKMLSVEFSLSLKKSFGKMICKVT